MLIERDGVSALVIGCAIAVHRELGPGLLESTYTTCLLVELEAAKAEFQVEVPIWVRYRQREIRCAYRADVIVGGTVLIEVKSVARFEKVHSAQVVTYLRLLNLKEGLLINFNVPLLKHGIRRVLL